MIVKEISTFLKVMNKQNIFLRKANAPLDHLIQSRIP